MRLSRPQEMDLSPSTTPKLKEFDVRCAVRSQLLPKLLNNKPGRVIEEVALLSGQIRVDLMVANGQLHGIEIKSEADTLERLGAQAKAYNQIFDTVTIVCGSNHAVDVAKLVPGWWAIGVAQRLASSVVIEEIRQGQRNREVDGLALLSLIWHEEAVELLKKAGVNKGLSAPKRALRQKLVDHYSTDQLRDEVREILKHRENWRADQRQE